MESIPSVIIPAHNEEASLLRTLRALPRECNPIVAVNGSTDGTERIAREFGAEVHVFEEPGKDAAFRSTLREMGNKALEPFLITDADTTPFMPRRWVDIMINTVRQVEASGPVAVAGLIGYRPEWAPLPMSIPTLVRTTRLLRRQHALTDAGLYYPCGANAAFRLDAGTRDALIEDPKRYWPGEDQFYFDFVRDMGGTATQCLRPGSLVFQSARSHPSLVRRILVGRKDAELQVADYYGKKGAKQPGVVEYRSPFYKQMVG